jgi:Tfp pilus assembly protein PilO
MLIDNLANFNRSTRTTVFSALIIIAAIAMYDWIVAPHVTCLSASQRYESVVNSAVEKNKAIACDIKVKTKKLEELRQKLAVSRSTLFTRDEAEELFSNLQAVAEGTGCTVHAFNLVGNKPSSGDRQKPEDTSGVTANSAKLTVSGQYNSIFELMGKLQDCAKKVWLDSFEMKLVDFSSGRLECNMTLTIYTIQDKGIAL